MSREPFQERAGDHFDWPLFLATLLIAVIGVINLYSATSVYTQSRAELYVSQVSFLLAGGALAVFFVVVDYRTIERYGYHLYVVGLFSLLSVFALARDLRGSKRWINFGFFSFQPSEFMKLFLIIALAKYFHNSPPATEGGRSLRDFFWPGAMISVPFLLVLKQPDLGTALILGLISISIIALTRIRWQTLAGVFITTPLAAIFSWFYVMHDYQKKRVTTFLDPESDIRGAGYHAHNARIAIGNGGPLGQGFMHGSQNQYGYLPDQYTDFPFPVFCEDWGFIGAMIVLTIYAFVVLWAVRIAAQAKDRFGAAAAIGVGALIFWHVVFNVGMVTGVLPVVGVTLPLFSYGGSSVITILLSLGLLMNISMRRTNITPVRTTFAR